MREQLALLPGYLTAHLQLTLAALMIGVGGSVPLGILAARIPAIERPLLALASVVQTVPSLALLALMVPLLAAIGLTSIGFAPALVALVLYSALPVLRNTVTGLAGVDPAMVEAARGLGMTPWQQLTRVEIPLALPTILAGVRTATVWTVGVATLSTPVGATSLGNYIFSGLQMRNHAAILVGCVAAAALALVLDGLVQLGAAAQARRDRRLGALSLGGMTVLALAAVAPLAGQWRGVQEQPIRIGAKTFTEQYVLAALIEQQVENLTAFRGEVRSSLGSTVAFDALVAGDIDVYVDYTGTIWSTVLQRDSVPDRATVFAEVSRLLAEQHDIVVVASLGFENTYALAMRRDRAEVSRIERIGDLAPLAGKWSMGADYEFLARPEWRAVRERYRLAFGQERSMDAALMYTAVVNGDVDVIGAFSTDGRIVAYDLRVLEDDRRVIPPYDAIVLVHGPFARRHPGVIEALRAMDGTISADAMRAMNAEVDQDGANPRDVAARHLALRSMAPSGDRDGTTATSVPPLITGN